MESKSSRYDLDKLGYIHATLEMTAGGDNVNWSKPPKSLLGSDCSLQFGDMKEESQVIAGQNTAVNS